MEEEQLIVLAVSSAGTCFLLVLSRDTSQKDAMFGVWTAMSELICQEKINMKSLLYPRSLQTIYLRTHGILKSDLKLLSFCGSMLFLSWHSLCRHLSQATPTSSSTLCRSVLLLPGYDGLISFKAIMVRCVCSSSASRAAITTSCKGRERGERKLCS